MISGLSAKYQFSAFHTADITAGSRPGTVMNRALCSESESKIFRRFDGLNVCSESERRLRKMQEMALV